MQVTKEDTSYLCARADEAMYQIKTEMKQRAE